jgi:hypothetical protein
MTTFLMTLGLAIGIIDFNFAQKTEKVAQIKVIMTINAPIDSTFNYIVPIDLSHIFKRYKGLPAVVKTNETEKWFKGGLTRTVFFDDGSTSKESLLTVVPNTSFSYKIEGFTSKLRLLAKRIEGDWQFTDLGNGQTKIEWTYKIIPKNAFTRGLIKVFLLKKVNGLLTNALTIIKNDLEK